MTEMNKIEPANRIKEIKEYYFSTKLAEIAQLNSKGWDIINLGVGAPDRMPSEQTIETLTQCAQQPDMHAYQPYTGTPELKAAYAKWYKKIYNVELQQQEILPLIGSKEGILHVSMAFLNKGDQVLVPNPGYPTYASVTRMLEAEVVNYDLLEENNWRPDFEALEQMDLSQVKIMWVNYPNMPTGADGDMELFEELIDFGKRHNIVICHDNPYSFILNDEPRSILSVDGAMDICLELNSLSKSHNMSGWRMGLLASNEQFIKWVLKAKSNVDSGQFKPMQLAAAAALENSTEWHQELNRVYAERRVWAEKIMDLLQCTFDKAQIGLFLWGKINGNGVSSNDFIDELLYKAKVFVTPGSIFGSNGDGYIRISLASDVEKIKEAHRRIQHYLESEKN